MPHTINRLKKYSLAALFGTALFAGSVFHYAHAQVDGVLQWALTGSYNGTANQYSGVVVDSTGFYVVGVSNGSGITNGTNFIEKRSRVDGSVIWSRTISSGAVIGIISIIKNDPSGIYVHYWSVSGSTGTAFTNKYDPITGALLWQYYDGGYFPNGYSDIATDGIGGLYVIGLTNIVSPTPTIQKLNTNNPATAYWTYYGPPQPAGNVDYNFRKIAVNDTKTSIYIFATWNRNDPRGIVPGWNLLKMRASDGAVEFSISDQGRDINSPFISSVNGDAYMAFSRGFSYNNFALLKINPSGGIVWDQTIMPGGFTMITGSNVTPSGAFLSWADGWSFFGGAADPSIIIEKRDLSTGNLVWRNTSNPSTQQDRAFGISVDGTDVFTVGYANWVSCGILCFTSTSETYIEKRATVLPNSAPTTPTLGGPATGVTNLNYTFTAQSTDPDGDQIRYGFDWNSDGTVDTWAGYVNSGIQGSASQQWPTNGLKTFQVLAQDTPTGANSGWATRSITISSPQCSDGVDNDGDGWTDLADPGCSSPSDNNESDNPQCSDSINNDSDAWIDYPADPGCTSIWDTNEGDNPQCSDMVDNDGDGLVDQNDPGCRTDPTNPGTYDPSRTSEQNTECYDGADNDGDGTIDAADTGCWSDITNPATYNPADTSENNCGNNICEAGKGETPLSCRADCPVIYREF